MQDNKEDLIKKIENNLRFVITISIFFLTIFPESRLAGSIIVVGYIIDYIGFQFRTKTLTVRNLKWIETSLLIGIGSYVVPLGIMAFSTQNIPLSQFGIWTWHASLFTSIWIIVCMPAITLAMIVLLSDKTWKSIREECIEAWSLLKKRFHTRNNS